MTVNKFKKALEKHLEIESSSEEQSKIRNGGFFLDETCEIHGYVFNDAETYSVTNTKDILSDTKEVVFDEEAFFIKKIEKTSPYERFTDLSVIKQLKKISKPEWEILAINQKALKVLFRDENGLLVVFKYSSHIPDDLSSYYMIGSTDEVMTGIKELFKDCEKIKENDKTKYD